MNISFYASGTLCRLENDEDIEEKDRNINEDVMVLIENNLGVHL